MHSSPELHANALAEDLIVVARGSARHLAACSLVLSAVGIDHLQNETTLMVPSDAVEAARFHLQAYQEENTNWPPTPEDFRIQQTPPPPTLLMIGGLFLFYQVTGPWEGNNPWFQSGAIDSRIIFTQGEWWRLLTALTLHADALHLLGNCLIGGFMVHLLCKTLGYGTGWLLLFISGSAGNLINIAVRESTHHSVGFSTAVFAAIGMFSGLQLDQKKFSLMNIIIPVGAGMGLLAFLGTEGRQTDLGAHLFGFCCGIAAGLIVSATKLTKTADNSLWQRCLFLFALSLLLFSWCLAYHHFPQPQM